MWRVGSKLIHPFNPELGIGVVRAIDGRFLRVFFPSADKELTLSPSASGIERLVLTRGAHARLCDTDEEVVIASSRGHSYTLEDGRVIDDVALWPLLPPETPLERLAGRRVDSAAALCNRIDGLRLEALREAGGLGSFLGGRIELFAHQLYTAQQAVGHDPVRWLLADEVGLGKTIEACLILSALVRTGRAKRALLIVPETLTVQWLGELYRKFHQIFALLDEDRLGCVAQDFGEDANPFEIHPCSVVAQELFLAMPELCEKAKAAGLDLVVVDEAHRITQSRVAELIHPLVLCARHALLLTATPLHADRRGFFNLLALLHPSAFDSFEAFEACLLAGTAQIPCASSVGRSDVGGLPPRVVKPVRVPLPGAVLRKDARVHWLIEHAQQCVEWREKTLVFVREVESLLALQEVLEARVQLRIPVFHEGLDAGVRDIEIAQFRDSASPLLLCSEAGGEGRNFQFCDRMVHFDLPFDPAVLEQRIGRLDRIGRKKPVEIVYFRYEGSSFDLAQLFERLNVFERAGAGLDPALVFLRETLTEMVRRNECLDVDALCAQVENKRRRELEKSPVHVFYPDAYDASMKERVLAQVPAGLEDVTRKFCLDAAEALGFTVVEKGGEARYYIEFGAEAIVEALPGVQGGSRFLGTFSRSEAVLREELDFFASGHPLVEGLLLELRDGVRGRAACLQFPSGVCVGSGLLIFWKEGARWWAEVVDTDGVPRPAWIEPLLSALSEAKTDFGFEAVDFSQWSLRLRELGQALTGTGEMVAAALFRATPE